MNIQISDSWLREFIDTKAIPKQIGEYLTLCSQSVERINKDGDDFIYDIEITTNRPDCMSVQGIVRELAAILPRFDIPAKLKEIPKVSLDSFDYVQDKSAHDDTKLPLNVKITKDDLCPRFTGLIYDNITIKPSPQFVQKRLQGSGIRALNNVIDISNYLMLELGQPMHTFDYDKILQSRMILRESKEGEEIVTLDGQKRKLHEGIIIIEDGKGRIVDLCGIMGAKNSETDENTKRVLLFVQTYNPMKIRRATQLLAFRTEAAARFEKGIDPEGVIPAMERATLLFKEWCGAKIASELIDIYPNPPQQISVTVPEKKINSLTGINIPLNQSSQILKDLGFKVETSQNSLTAIVPHWRNGDISIPEDLIEEIARIYGYFNLPNVIPPLSMMDQTKEAAFDYEYQIKTALKYWGFTETMSYSMVGKDLLTKAGMNPEHCHKITNPLTEDLTYLRTSLVPSLLEVISKNASEDKIDIFEMANTYMIEGKDALPDESMELTLASTNKSYAELKGTIEQLFKELGIENVSFKECGDFLRLSPAASIDIGDENIGIIGKVTREMLDNFDIKKDVFVFDLEMKRLLKFANKSKKYIPIPKYPPIIEDLTFVVPLKTKIGEVIEEIKKVDDLIKKVELIDTFEDCQTFRITYQSEKENLTDSQVKPIREKVIRLMENEFFLKIKIA